MANSSKEEKARKEQSQKLKENSMPVKKKHPGVQFGPGNQAAKGHGRPPMRAEEKGLALANRTHIKRIMNEYLSWTIEEIEDHLETAKLPIIDMAILKALKNGFNSGSLSTIDWCFDHVLGKESVKTDINLNGNIDTGIDLKKLPMEDLLKLKEIAQRANDKNK